MDLADLAAVVGMSVAAYLFVGFVADNRLRSFLSTLIIVLWPYMPRRAREWAREQWKIPGRLK